MASKVQTSSGMPDSVASALLKGAMQQIAEFTGYGFTVIDRDGRLIWANPGFEKRYGYTLAEMKGREIGPFLQGPMSDPTVLDRLRDARRKGEMIVLETLNYSKDKHARWVEITSQPLAEDGAEPGRYYVAVERDITKRKLAEALSAAQHGTLRKLAEDADLATVLDTLVRSIESVATEMRTSIMLLDETGRRLKSVTGPRLPADYLAALDGTEIGPNVGSCGTAAHEAQRIVSANIFEDPKWQDYQALAELSGMRACWSEPIMDIGGTVVGTFAIYYPFPYRPTVEELDFIRRAAEIAGVVVDRKALEDDLERAKSRAEAANVAKSRFLANMSHELRTPLNAMIGFSDLIASGAFEDDVGKYAEYAGEIGNAARILLEAVTSLLEAAKLQEGRYVIAESAVDIAAVIRDCVNEKTDVARQGEVTLVLETPRAQPIISADAASVRNILTRILDNALKYTPSGGEIGIGMRVSTEGELSVSVTDSGEGIPEEDIGRILQPFEQGGFASAYLARRYGGAGLGLAISHMLMQLHGGDVVLYSEAGKGTRVQIVFPAARVLSR